MALVPLVPVGLVPMLSVLANCRLTRKPCSSRSNLVTSAPSVGEPDDELVPLVELAVPAAEVRGGDVVVLLWVEEVVLLVADVEFSCC